MGGGGCRKEIYKISTIHNEVTLNVNVEKY